MTNNGKKLNSAYIGLHKIYTADWYKYLGVIFDNKMSFKKHIEMIAEKADKYIYIYIYTCALYGSLAENKEWKGFQPRILLHLFDHPISPILSYESVIWGNRELKEIEKIHTCLCASLL